MARRSVRGEVKLLPEGLDFFLRKEGKTKGKKKEREKGTSEDSKTRRRVYTP